MKMVVLGEDGCDGGHNDDCDGSERLRRVAFASALATFIAIAKGTKPSNCGWHL